MRHFLRNLGFLWIGLFIGGGLALYLAWVAWPLEVTDANPSHLPAEAKEDYALMIAMAYAQDGDLALARWRLATLGKPDSNSWYLGVTVDAILAGKDENQLRRMARLANDLGLQSPALMPYLADNAGS